MGWRIYAGADFYKYFVPTGLTEGEPAHTKAGLKYADTSIVIEKCRVKRLGESLVNADGNSNRVDAGALLFFSFCRHDQTNRSSPERANEVQLQSWLETFGR